MEYAASIRYGGQLFSAKECTHGDFLNLGLICPNCKAPVTYREAHTRRKSSGESVPVRAQFAHRANTNPVLVKECEARVARYSPKELSGRANRAKNQRLKLLHQWFWKIFLTYNIHMPDTIAPNHYELTNKYLEESIKSLDRNPTTKLVTITTLEYFVELIENKKNQRAYHKLLDNFCNEYITGTQKINHYESVENQFKLRHKFQLFRNSIDVEMHRLIVKEVFDFLSFRTSKPLLEKLFWFHEIMIGVDPAQQKAFKEVYQDLKTRESQLTEPALRANCHINPILRLLTEIAWADAYCDLTNCS